MIESILSSVAAVTIVNGLILYLLKDWISTRLKSSIDAEHKRQHELFTRDLDKKEKIGLVSETLAEWIRTPPDKNISREDRTNLNKLSFKCTLWLPPDLSKELSKTLQGIEGAKSIFELLLMARKELIDDEEIDQEHVTYWGYENESVVVKLIWPQNCSFSNTSPQPHWAPYPGYDDAVELDCSSQSYN